MAFSLKNAAEAGVDGATVSTADPGDPDSWDSVSIAAGSTLKYAASAAYRGGLGYQFRATAAVKMNLGWRITGSTMRWRGYINIHQYLGSQFIQFLGPGGVTSGIAGYVQLSGTGQLQIIDSGGTNRVSTDPVPLNQWIRLETIWNAGGANGNARIVFYSGDSTTPLFDTGVVTVSTSTSFTGFNFGKSNGSGIWTNGFDADEIAFDDASTTALIGPAPLPGPVLRATYNSGAQSNVSPLNVPGVQVFKDDVVVVVALTSDYLRRINAPPTGLTGTTFVEEGGVYGQVNYSNAYSWTAKAQQDETVTIQAVPSGGNAGADFVIMRVYVFSNAEGAGDTILGGGWASAKGSATLPSLTQTNVADHSAIIFAAVDWNARSATGAAFTSTGGAGAPTTDYAVSTSAAGYYAAEYLDAGLKGAKTVAMSAPASQKWSAISIEVVGKGLGPQVPRWNAFLQLDSVSDFEIIPPPEQLSDLPMAASAGMSIGSTKLDISATLLKAASSALIVTGQVQHSAVLAMRATPAASAAAVRSQLATLPFAAAGSMSPQTSPQSSLVLPGTAGLVVAGSESRNAVVAAVAVSGATMGALRQQAAVWAAAGSSGAAFGNMRGLLGVLVAAAAGGMVPNTGWSATFAPRATPTMTLAARQSFLRTLAMGATSGVVIFVTTFEQPHYSKRVIAVVLDSGKRIALLDPVGGTAELVPVAGLAELLGAGH